MLYDSTSAELDSFFPVLLLSSENLMLKNLESTEKTFLTFRDLESQFIGVLFVFSAFNIHKKMLE